MSLDKSLKTAASLTRHRNVPTRAERIEKLRDDGKWTDQDSPFGLPKIAHRKVHTAAREKESAKTEETTTPESTGEASTT